MRRALGVYHLNGLGKTDQAQQEGSLVVTYLPMYRTLLFVVKFVGLGVLLGMGGRTTLLPAHRP